MLFAPKNRGKTFLGLHLAYSIATRQSHYLGCRINGHGSVICLCAEGRGGLVKRRAAWRQAHRFEELVPSLAIPKDLIDIRDDEQVRTLIAAVHESYPACVLVVIDALSQHMRAATKAPAT